MEKWSNLTVAYFFRWVGKSTTNQFFVTCYTLIVDEVDCEFHLLSVTGAMKQKHHTNHPNFRRKIEPERTKSKKSPPPPKKRGNFLTYKNCLIRKSPLWSPHGWGHFVTHVSSILAISRVATAETLQRLALAVLGSCFESESPGVSGRKTLGWKLQNISRWWFQIFFMFTANLGEDEPFLTSIFSNGLVQPPTIDFKGSLGTSKIHIQFSQKCKSHAMIDVLNDWLR